MAESSVKALLTVNVTRDGASKDDQNKKYKDAKNNMHSMEQSSKNILKNLGSAFKNTALVGWLLTIKETTESLIDLTKAQTEYIENLNLMQVAFGETKDQAESFVNTLSSKIGFDNSSITRQLGVFRQIGSAMQYDAETADLLSKNLTKLQLDVSSLYNTSIERAGKSLESAITGNVMSIRRLTGADITQATLQQEALARGINKSTREMTRAEKTILIYLALERQLSNANGDVSRTINSVANQTKIFRDQITMAGRQIGAFFIPILKTLLPILNGVLMVFNAILGALLSLIGIDASSMASEFGVASGGIDLIEDSLDGVTESANEAKKSLRGFDKLNNITTPTASSGSGGAIGGGLGAVDNKFLEALEEYNLQLEKMKNKATEIRDRILSWLGFTIDENGKLKWTGNLFQAIFDIILGIVGLAGIIKKVSDAFLKIGKFLGIVNADAVGISFLTALKYAGLLAIAIGGIVAIMKVLNDYSKENTDRLQNASEETKARLQPVQQAFNDLKDVVSSVSYDGLALTQEEEEKITSSIDNLTASLKTAVKDYVEEQIKNVNYMYYTLGIIDEKEYNTAIQKLTDYLNDKYDEYDQHGEDLKNQTKTLYDEEGNIIASNYATWLHDMQKYETDQLALLTTNENDKATILRDAERMDANERKKYYEKVLMDAVANKDKIIENAKTQRDGMLQSLKITFGEESEEYKTHAKKVNDIYDGIVQDAEDDYNELYDTLAGTVNDMESIVDRKTGKVRNFFEIMAYNIKEEFKGLQKTASEVFNKIFGDSEKLSSIGGGKFSIGGSGYGGMRAEGGFVNSGDIFIANENNKPEYIGSFGNRTAVANTDQIVDGISIGVARAMASVKPTTDVNIVAKGDTSGLLNFIEFEQRKKNRQYGL